MPDIMDRLVASPCCVPEMPLEPQLEAYSALGFRKYEAFTTWAAAALDLERDPVEYRSLFSRHGMAVTSFHLPPVKGASGPTFERAVRAARFAHALGAGVILYKATDRDAYIDAGVSLLDVVDDLGLTVVVQNHAGSPISTLDDYREVIDGIGDDRLGAVLEVGHLHAAGVDWRDGLGMLADRIALVHIKDQVGAESVPYGQGEIDLPALFRVLDTTGYAGDIVVEMEVPGATTEQTIRYLAAAIEFLSGSCAL